MTRRVILVLGLVSSVGFAAGCPSGDCTPAGTTGGATTGSGLVGGAVVGIVDNHCWGPGSPDGGLTFISQAVEAASCHVMDGGPFYDEDAGPPGAEYGPFNYNSSANDDDCKYFVGWRSTPIVAGSPVTFWVSGQLSTNGAPLTGMVAAGQPGGSGEIYLEVAGVPDGGISGHVSPTVGMNVPIEETPAGSGVYKIGPAVFFDESGLWYIRYHFNENCDDVLPDSPHGHTAFYVDVP